MRRVYHTPSKRVGHILNMRLSGSNPSESNLAELKSSSQLPDARLIKPGLKSTPDHQFLTANWKKDSLVYLVLALNWCQGKRLLEISTKFELFVESSNGLWSIHLGDDEGDV